MAQQVPPDEAVSWPAWRPVVRLGKGVSEHREKKAKWPTEESSSQIWLCAHAPRVSLAHLPRPHGPHVCVPEREQLPGNSYKGEESAVHLHILLCCLPNSRSHCPGIQRRSPLTAGRAGGGPAESVFMPRPRPVWHPLRGHCPQLTGPWRF